VDYSVNSALTLIPPFLLQVPCATKAHLGKGGNERAVELVKRQD